MGRGQFMLIRKFKFFSQPPDGSRPLGVLSFLIVLLAASAGFADDPLAIAVEAEVEEDAPRGTAVRICSGKYPPQTSGGWFAFESGNKAEIFALNESTGTITLNRTDRWEAWRQSSGVLTIEHGSGGESAGQLAKRRFLLAAGLTEQEVSRRLGLVTHYAMTLRVKSRRHAPQFPPRALHFFWPAQGKIISEVQAQDSDPGEEIRYRLIDQQPENWIEIDPATGVLRLRDEQESDRRAEIPWRGVVEARDAFGLASTTTIWVTQPLALPSLSVPSLNTFWPREKLTYVRDLASGSLQSILPQRDSWRFDLERFSNRQQPEFVPSASQPTHAPSPDSEVSTNSAEGLKSPNVESGETAGSLSSIAWKISLLAMAALLGYGILRHRKSPKPLDSMAESSPKEAPPLPVEIPAPPESLPKPSLTGESAVPKAAKAKIDRPPQPAVDPDPPAKPPEKLPAAGKFREAKLILVEEDDTEADAESAKGSAPSPEELQKLLSLLDNTYNPRGPSESASAPPAAKTSDVPQPTPEPKPKPETEPEDANAISDYMNQLMARYSKPGAKTASAPATCLVEAAPKKPLQNEPKRVVHRDVSGILEPVCTYDREISRSQLQLLRETSNCTAANAIRLAASRRRRKALRHWGLLVVIFCAMYAGMLILID